MCFSKWCRSRLHIRHQIRPKYVLGTYQKVLNHKVQIYNSKVDNKGTWGFFFPISCNMVYFIFQFIFNSFTLKILKLIHLVYHMWCNYQLFWNVWFPNGKIRMLHQKRNHFLLDNLILNFSLRTILHFVCLHF